MKKNFSDPKILTGGIDIKQWNKHSKEEHRLALSKDWYVYFSVRLFKGLKH